MRSNSTKSWSTAISPSLSPRCSSRRPMKRCRSWSRSARSAFRFWRGRSARFFSAPMAIARGRKSALTLSIFLMTIGTALMTIMPSYGAVGILAPILVVGARLLQGFSVGGEFASSTAFLVEHRPDRAGFFASWQWASQGLAALIATGFGVLLTATMSAADLQSWGWRIPFAFGLLIGPVGYYIRSRLPETPEFLDAGQAPAPLRDLFVDQWDRLLITT